MHQFSKKLLNFKKKRVVSHIQNFGDASTSPAWDATSLAEDVGASPKFWMCDTVEYLNRVCI